MLLGDGDIMADGPRDCGTFFLDAIGAFAPEGLVLAWGNERRAANEEVDRLIEETWRVETARAEAAGRHLFDGPMCRLIDWRIADGRLALTLGAVSYREFMGTNATRANVRYRYGPEVMANPLGVSAAVVTDDGFLLLGRRSRQVALYAERIHPIGGIVEPPEPPGTPPDPFMAMAKEIEEELGLSPAPGVAACLGIVRDKHTVQPEMIFDMSVAADVEAVQRAAAGAVHADEHTELVHMRNHPGAVVSFVEQHYGQLTPIGLAALLLHGLRNWGIGWFTATRGYLRSVI